ncbi:hypothetical protein CUMW_018690 [Citrus unshiu]|nr:hypothetical protein CUMW_018690 [Citrus unshiu]
MSTSAYIRHTCPLASFACTPRSKAFSFQLRVSTHSPLHSSHCKLHRRRPPPMSSDHAGTNFPDNKLEPIQLNDESDFYQITSPDGLISISGFGSLLSENSARSTFPNLINFRVAKLHGFRRVFAHVAPIFFERGIAKPETKEISSLSVEPCEGETLIVTVFEIQKSEVLCARSSDEEFFQIRCKGSKEIYFHHYGRYNIDKIWRDDILPCLIAVLFHPAQYALAASTNLRRGNSKLNPTRNLVSLYWKKNDLTLV